MRRWLLVVALAATVVAIHSPRIRDEQLGAVADAAVQMSKFAFSDENDSESEDGISGDSAARKSGEVLLEAQADAARAARLLEAEAREEVDAAAALDNLATGQERHCGYCDKAEKLRKHGNRLRKRARRAVAYSRRLRKRAWKLLDEAKHVLLLNGGSAAGLVQQKSGRVARDEPLVSGIGGADDLINSARSMLGQAKHLKSKSQAAVQASERMKSSEKYAAIMAGVDPVVSLVTAGTSSGTDSAFNQEVGIAKATTTGATTATTTATGTGTATTTTATTTKSGVPCSIRCSSCSRRRAPPTPAPVGGRPTLSPGEKVPTPRPKDTPPPTPEPTRKPTPCPTPEPTPQLPPGGCPFQGKPMWENVEIDDCDGRCDLMKASRVCEFMGMVKAADQDERQEELQPQSLKEVWRQGSCRRYKELNLPEMKERTSNGVTFCKLTYRVETPFSVWKLLRCDCPKQPPLPPCTTTSPKQLPCPPVPAKCPGELSTKAQSLTQTLHVMMQKLARAKMKGKGKRVAALLKKEQHERALLNATKREYMRVKANKMAEDALMRFKKAVTKIRDAQKKKKKKLTPAQRAKEELLMAEKEKKMVDNLNKTRTALIAEQVQSYKLASFELNRPMSKKRKARAISHLKRGIEKSTRGISALKKVIKKAAKRADRDLARATRHMKDYESEPTVAPKASVLEESDKRIHLQPENCIVRAKQNELVVKDLAPLDEDNDLYVDADYLSPARDEEVRKHLRAVVDDYLGKGKNHEDVEVRPVDYDETDAMGFSFLQEGASGNVGEQRGSASGWFSPIEYGSSYDEDYGNVGFGADSTNDLLAKQRSAQHLMTGAENVSALMDSNTAGLIQLASEAQAYLNTCVRDEGGQPRFVEQETGGLEECKKLCRGVKACSGLVWSARDFSTASKTCRLTIARTSTDKTSVNVT
eukprot:TRINITY_DN31495_c0_g3_i1.p1 TRINITY_DN31495_c0_g3~~TRINITY_DN31495_c0_g3_i1.p1  ORF type:complete len:928 (-),score=163.86 TRINITY_DN31495_c0_g3_i1:54-2837(-)